MEHRAKPTMREPHSYRSDPAVPSFPDDRPIFVFDGHCVLCSAAAQFVLRHDKRRRFRLLAAQTPLGAAIYSHYGLDSTNYQTNIVLEDGRAWLKSESSIRLFERLGFPWSLAAVARVLPRGLRDRLYDIVARNRLKWFGVRETCLVATQDAADRFLQ
jgi:predicted DCC family thiol-disulfide oxidoreductase YuxK